MSSRLRFELLRGVPLDLAADLLMAEDDDGDSDDQDEEDGEEVGVPVRLSDLNTTRRPALRPSTTERSAGANQLGRKTFGQRLKREHGESFLLAVQSTNRWGTAGVTQPYAVSVTLWRSVDHAELYTELHAEFEAVEVEVPVEVEI